MAHLNSRKAGNGSKSVSAKTPGRSGDMYTGEISCKDEDGLKQFIDDHEGLIFAEEDSLEMVILCFRHSDMRISPEEWEKMDCPVSVREIYGQMQEVKIVKDHKTHLTTFYY